MPYSDNRAEHVQRFCQERGATRVHILTVHAPFTVRQDRFVVLERGAGGQFISGKGCTPRTPLGTGEERPLYAETLAAFLRAVEAASEAWDGDAVPPNMHDGVTLTCEQADADDYRRVRIVDPAPGSAHARLIAAWTAAFPDVRRALS
jgi:hypothetical protein